MVNCAEIPKFLCFKTQACSFLSGEQPLGSGLL